MKRILYKLPILGALFLFTEIEAQIVLEALEAPDVPVLDVNSKCLERVKDKYYGDGIHNFIYCAVAGPNGKKWLNLNLGAEYARVSTNGVANADFNPEAQPTGRNDSKAFGSLFQVGRDADGHELVQYDQGSKYWRIHREYAPIDYADTYKDNLPPVYLHNFFQHERTVYNGNEWSGTMNNNPCPTGYRVMNKDDVRALFDGSKIIYDGKEQEVLLTYRESLPNLKLLLAPITSKDEVAGWNDTTALVEQGDTLEQAGTSTLWLGDYGIDEVKYIIENSKVPLNVYESNKWIVDEIVVPSEDDKKTLTKYFVFDNGVFPTKASSDVYRMGYSVGKISRAIAIRCVEK